MFDKDSTYKKTKSILDRCAQDTSTCARLKYNPWYHHFDKQDKMTVWKDGKEMLMMSCNDYLGLSFHPKVIEDGQKAIAEWGCSTTGSRLANGSRKYHIELEEALAEFLGKESAIVLSAGYLACVTAVSTFAQKDDLILVDRNVHSSLWTGIMMSGADIERIAHNDPSDLQDILMMEDRYRPKMLVVEGVYSMEGHIARLHELLEVCEPHNCFIVLDDAHGLGVLGDRGQGTAGYLDRTKEVNVICGSLSKSMASTGGFIAGSNNVIEYLKTHSKQTIFSAAISPVQAICAKTSLEILISEPEHRERLWENTKYYKKLLNHIGVNIWESQTPAVPIVLGNKERVYRVWKNLMDEGIFTVISIPPAVPQGKDLIRTAVSALHTKEDLERFVETLGRCLKRV